ERLDHIAFGPALEAQDAILGLALGGQYQNAGVADRWIGADRLANVVAGLVGQHQIEHHDLGSILAYDGETVHAGARRHRLEAGAPEVELEQACNIVLVFDDDHATFHSAGYIVVTRL